MTILKRLWRSAGKTGSATVRAMLTAARQSVLITLLGALPCLGLAADPNPFLSSHVMDQAQVLDVGAVNLDRKLKAFEASSGHQVFVLTVPTTGTRPIDQYAVEAFEKWKLGRTGVDNGVLFVIAVADRRMRFEVGYGLEGILTDAKCSRIIREIVAPQFAQGRYDAGIEAGVDAVLLTLSPPSVRTADVATRAAFPDSVPPKPRDPIRALAIFVVVLAVLGILTINVGLVGLLVFALFAMILSAIPMPGVDGKLMFTAAISAWLVARWFRIAKNVREHHLSGSKNHLLTWLWIFFFTRGSGTLSDVRQRSAITVSFSFTSDNSNESASDESDCSDHGGRSGGGGASGQW